MSDAIAPVVVDSPLPVEPVAADPALVESLLSDAPDTMPVVSDPDEIESPPSDDMDLAPVVAPKADESVVKIKSLGDAIGYDLSRFKTVDDAEAAADMLFERFAEMGGNGDIAAALRPDAVEDDAIDEQPDDLGLDEATTDPAIIAAFKKLAGQNAELRKSVATKKTQDAAQQIQNVVKVAEQKAESFLDGLDTPTFGKNGKRNSAQQAAAEVVGKIGFKILTGMIADARRNGRTSVPPIETIMQVAVKKAGFEIKAKAAEKGAATKAYSLQPKSHAGSLPVPTGMPRVAPQNDPNGYFTSKDPNIQAIWAETLRRVSR